MLSFILIIGLLIIATLVVINQPKFGKSPSGKRLERIEKSPHYKNGKFNNLHHTPQFAEDASPLQVMYRFLFKKVNNKIPAKPLQFSKTNLHNLRPEENVLVWMGHSSYYLQMDGKKMLIDPVFSGYASPFSFVTKSFDGSNIYSAEDIPALDYLIITHDHWDHLDYHTVTKLFPKVKQIITGLGTGEHLEYWGFDSSKIIELDWFEKADLADGFTVYCEPARHFSGRGFKRDGALWVSFLMQSPQHKIYIGGDSGFDTHFKEIGEKHDSIDLAILELGQYNEDWKYIHMLPGEQLQATKDLRAKSLMPVHNSKFALATHAWNEPLQKITELNTDSLHIITPAIGEKVNWLDKEKIYEKWWEKFE